MKTIFDDKGKDIYILYVFLSCDFFENGWICMYMYIYLYVYTEIGKKTKRLYFHPYKPVSWSLTHQGIFIKSPDEWVITKQACMDESSLFVFSLSQYISRSTSTYWALYCGKSKHRLPIYIYYFFFNFLLFDILARVGNLAINVNPFLSFSGIN